MKAFLSEYEGCTLELDQALLIYKDENGQCMVTNNNYNRDSGELESGRPINRQRLAELIAMLSDHDNNKLTLMSDNLLALSAGAIIWWKPEHKDNIFFKTSNKKVSALSGKEVTWPALVFKANSAGMFVYALEHSRRPDADTPLLIAPFWNVYKDGRICLPGGNKSCKFTPSQIEYNERLLFDSAFTHATAADLQITYTGGHDALWRYMASSRAPEKFPVEFLTKSDKKLKDLCND